MTALPHITDAANAALRTLVRRLLDADPALVDIVDEFCNPNPKH